MENNTPKFIILFDKSPEVKFLDSLRSFLSEHALEYEMDSVRVSGTLDIDKFLDSQVISLNLMDLSGPIGNIFPLTGYMRQVLDLPISIPTDRKYDEILNGFKILYYVKLNKHLKFL